jgi:hypothetical protein
MSTFALLLCIAAKAIVLRTEFLFGAFLWEGSPSQQQNLK